MKMSDITNEAGGLRTAGKYAGQAWDAITGAANKVGDIIMSPYRKTAYKDPTVAQQQGQLKSSTTMSKDVDAINKEIAALKAKGGDPEKIANLEKELVNVQTAKKDYDTKTFTNKEIDPKTGRERSVVKRPDYVEPDKYSSAARMGQVAYPTAGTLGFADWFTSGRDPETGKKQPGMVSKTVGDWLGYSAEVPGNLVSGTPDGKKVSVIPQAPSAAGRENDDPNALKESLSDILKLAGSKAITERDNVSGMTKVKEIKQLNESTDLNECGMGMPSSANTTASLSINATAGSGEEVANMLKSLMDLAGVKPVTGDMLGGATTPMPMVKAIDIISRPHDHEDHDHDSMEPQEDELNKTPLTGMEEEYANTPAKATDVPEYDPEKMVFRPNQPQQGNRMDGTMPKANPGLNEENLAEALLKEYEAFKNGQ